MLLRATNLTSCVNIILLCSYGLESLFFSEHLLHTKYILTVENLKMSEKDEEDSNPLSTFLFESILGRDRVTLF